MTKLLELRDKIDRIDDKIIDLLKERIQIVDEVGKFKAEQGIKGSFIRAGREARMVRNLTARTKNIYPTQAIYQIWRMIIASSLQHEKPLYIATNGLVSLCEAYFGSFMPITNCDNDSAVYEAYNNKKCDVLVFPYPTQGDWWCYIPENCAIFAHIPFVNPKHQRALALAEVAPEATGDDRSLWKLADKDEATALIACKNAGIETNIVSKQQGNILLETTGFYVTQEEISAILPDIDVTPLGAYATPINA